MPYPGSLTRAEIATGLLVRSVKINGNYLLVDNCTINQVQEINANPLYLQGGPGSAIANIGAKKYEGELSFPIRVDRDNVLDPAVQAILQHAESPMSGLTLDTNHLLSHFDITAEDGATDNNELLTVDQLVIKSLTITANENDYVKVNASFQGMIDTRAASDYAVPDEDHVLGRSLTWGDCDASRYESSLRTVSNFEITIENELEALSFLMAGDLAGANRSDQISLIGVKSVKWSGQYSEILRKGMDLDSAIHGGWMVDENLIFNIGSITTTFRTPLFQKSELPLSSKMLIRKIKWNGLINPSAPLRQGGLFSF